MLPTCRVFYLLSMQNRGQHEKTAGQQRAVTSHSHCFATTSHSFNSTELHKRRVMVGQLYRNITNSYTSSFGNDMKINGKILGGDDMEHDSMSYNLVENVICIR